VYTAKMNTTSLDPISKEPEKFRLNKHLALQLGVSRREADNLISAARVTINAETAHLGARFTTADTIAVDDKALKSQTSYVYLALHKPTGYVCSKKRQGDTPTIYDLLPNKYHHLNPVGRLDANSSGILLLTNDGDFAYRMTHPKFHKQKRYEVKLSHKLEPLHRQMMSDYGVQLEDGISKLQLERLNDGDETQWTIAMHEGRNRQIRRTFGSLGYEVIGLHRTNFGDYSLGDIKSGATQIVNMR